MNNCHSLNTFDNCTLKNRYRAALTIFNNNYRNAVTRDRTNRSRDTVCRSRGSFHHANTRQTQLTGTDCLECFLFPLLFLLLPLGLPPRTAHPLELPPSPSPSPLNSSLLFLSPFLLVLHPPLLIDLPLPTSYQFLLPHCLFFLPHSLTFFLPSIRLL